MSLSFDLTVWESEEYYKFWKAKQERLADEAKRTMTKRTLDFFEEALEVARLPYPNPFLPYQASC
ncbi:uncharacterized protein ColSpa_07083 [Colletotrichum spaethianum]|uniref:Uncharacterized protein n=1 Tax=Colletotrichum spaethianum TaxID=700344 RepID=A0AA37LLN2_9PEZI|nr:uncharacterized protein ColSpa_07083 [Colletotrichum spaethianum]GKT46902.1 hypothetical protein ColSpa_07083 [Colletotrichum spaethianum]